MIKNVKIVDQHGKTVFELEKYHNITVEYDNKDELVIEPRWSDANVLVSPNKHYSSSKELNIRTHKWGFTIEHAKNG